MGQGETLISNPYKKEDKKTLAECVISQIDLCRKEFSKEMKPGFNQKTFFNGEWIIISVPDQREVDIAVVKTLYDLLMFFFDDIFNKRYKEIIDKLNKSSNKFLEQYIAEETLPHLKKIAEETKRIPQDRISNLSGNIRQRHLNYIVECYREIFQELVLLFKRKNELSGKRSLGHK